MTAPLAAPVAATTVEDEAFGSRADADAAFLRLREVLGAPDRHGWRRWLGRLRPSPTDRPDRSENLGGDDASVRRPPRLAAVVALPLIGAAVVLLVSIARSPGSAAPPTTMSAPGPTVRVRPDDRARPAPTTSIPQRVWPAEPVAIDGNNLRIGPDRWSVGAPGDVVVVGDWDCDRQPTPAVLRAGRGLYVFDTWAAEGREVTARKVADAKTAVAVTAEGCGVAVLQEPDGREQRLDLTRPQP